MDIHDQQDDDDLLLSILLNNSEDDNETLMADETCALELHLQEAIFSSFTFTPLTQKLASTFVTGDSSKTCSNELLSPHSLCEICGDIKDNDEMFQIENCTIHDDAYCKDCISKHVSIELMKKRRRTVITCPRADILRTCEICADDISDMFPLHCDHNFFTDCISKHVTIMIKKRRTEAVVTFPAIGCTAVLESHTLRAVLAAEVVSVWDDVLCESLISPKMNYYCPYKDCSGLLVRENGDELIRESEGPFCHRLLCAN